MSNYIEKLKNWDRYMCVDNYFWPHDYGYIKLEETDNWTHLNIQGKKALTEEMFDKLKKSL